MTPTDDVLLLHVTGKLRTAADDGCPPPPARTDSPPARSCISRCAFGCRGSYMLALYQALQQQCAEVPTADGPARPRAVPHRTGAADRLFIAGRAADGPAPGGPAPC